MMAERVNSFPPSKQTSYPWSDWFDGSIWKLTQGEDFTSTFLAFRTLCYQTASRKNMRVQTRQDGNQLWLRASDKDDVA